MEAAKRSYARALKGSKKTNAERAKHRNRSKSALSRYTQRNPNAKKPAPPPATAPAPAPVNQMDKFTLGIILNGIRERKRKGMYEVAYPKTHIPKRAHVRNTTVARERAQRVANAYTRRLRTSQQKPSGVPSRAEERRRASISRRRSKKPLFAISESGSGSGSGSRRSFFNVDR
jgi:hypothetical protein